MDHILVQFFLNAKNKARYKKQEIVDLLYSKNIYVNW